MASLSGRLGHGQVQCHIALTFLDKHMSHFIWANGYLGMWVIGHMGTWAKNVFGQVGISANQGLKYRTGADVCTDLTIGKEIRSGGALSEDEEEQQEDKCAGQVQGRRLRVQICGPGARPDWRTLWS